MICLVEALNYRSLRRLRQRIAPFNIRIGPNASGKTTFLDVVALVGEGLKHGPEESIRRRARSIKEMTWNRPGKHFELALEFDIPQRLQGTKPDIAHTHCRYEMALGHSSENEAALLHEVFWLKPAAESGNHSSPQVSLPLPPEKRERDFPGDHPPVALILTPSRAARGWRKVVNKISASGNDWFKAESGEWNTLFRLGPRRSSLANLLEDEQKFPVATWAKIFLMEGVHLLAFNSSAIRQPCSPLSPKRFVPDGSNLPIVVLRW
ncbi:MAG: hypothetical protein ONB48_12365 [candidate division KSB1 bacterium]|nr:hypothetical protein [candidate division KSB1 bacterium]MDZ7275112.1 hypothetical protein [candidate division KSB1 bacterium]MDZ7286440.1 hypothetical protein [candidate division KSB1 bacterium]MDZ7299396.1 hypothetical protein [candidate division KSB1 bacterium]MDZ7307826.1 hypothetical protein [candidate division KSB1 bacterium]